MSRNATSSAPQPSASGLFSFFPTSRLFPWHRCFSPAASAAGGGGEAADHGAYETVAITDYAPRTSLTGVIAARTLNNLSFRVGGRVAERLVDVGQHVEKDAVLARLDPQEQESDLRSAEADLDAAQAQLTQATAAFERQKTLLAQGFTTRREYDPADQAQKWRKACRSGAEPARQRPGQAVLHRAESRRGRHRHRPQLDAGQVAQAAQTVFTVAEDGDRDAVFNVHETMVAKRRQRRRWRHAAGRPAVMAMARCAKSRRRSIRFRHGPGEGRHSRHAGSMPLGAAVIGINAMPAKAVVLPWQAPTSNDGKPAVWILDPATGGGDRAGRSAGLRFRQGVVDKRAGGRREVVTAGGQFLSPGQIVELARRRPNEAASIWFSCLAVWLTALAACAKPQQKPPEFIRPVLSILSSRRRRSLGFAGTVEPQVSADLAFRLLGRVVSRDVEIGDFVRKGETIATLDPTALQLAVQAAKADSPAPRRNSPTRPPATTASDSCSPTATPRRPTTMPPNRRARGRGQCRAGQGRARQGRGTARLRAADRRLRRRRHRRRRRGRPDRLARPDGGHRRRPDLRDAVVDVPDQLTGDLAVGDAFEVALQSLPSDPDRGKCARSRRRPTRRRARGGSRSRSTDPPHGLPARLDHHRARVTEVAPRSAAALGAARKGRQRRSGSSIRRHRPSATRDVEVAAEDGAASSSPSGLEPATRVVTAGVHSLTEGQQVKLDGGRRREALQPLRLGARAPLAGLVFHDRVRGRRASSPISASAARRTRPSPSRR